MEGLLGGRRCLKGTHGSTQKILSFGLWRLLHLEEVSLIITKRKSYSIS